jgi:hypothetical protein
LEEREFKELQTIKGLLVLQLLKQGVAADFLADFLNMDRADFSRAYPVRKLLRHKAQK